MPGNLASEIYNVQLDNSNNNTVNSRCNEFQGTEKKIRYMESSLHRENIPIEFVITRFKPKIQNFNQ